MEDSELCSSFIDTGPGHLVMDRNEFAPVKQTEHGSLRQKLLAHYQKGMKSSRHDELQSSFPSEFVNRSGVLLYLFTVITALKFGVLDVMPLIYEGNDKIVLLQQCLVCFIFLEVMVNWLAIRYVDSSYQEYISANGNPNLHKQLSSVYRLTHHQARTRDSSGSKSPDRNFMDSNYELIQEAARVNIWMDKRNEQINSRSIADLICINENNSSYSTQEQQNLTAVKADTCNWMSPKPVIKVDGKFVTESYPYWSWVPCYSCGHARPPRCHHCPLCRTCVLKRDHHCFFTGSCIGYRNLRFFIVFIFWALIASVYGTFHGIHYLFLVIWPQIAYFDTLFPIAIARFLFGYLSFHTALSLTTLSFVIVSNCFATFYLILHIQLIFSGLTSFEKAYLKQSLEIKDTRKLNKKLKAVFGRFWLLNFIFPAHFFLKPEEDPVYWPDIQVFKH